MKRVILLLIGFLVLSSCKNRENKDSSTTIESLPKDARESIKDTRFFYKEINKKSRFKRLKITNKISIKTDSFIPTINGIIYIENDKKIWINLSSFFINVGRGLAEKKEFQGYLKQPEKIAIQGDYNDLKKITHIDFLDYNSIQKLLMGENFIPIHKESYLLKKHEHGYLLESKETIHFNENDIEDEKYAVSLWYNTAFQLMKMEIINATKTEKTTIEFSNRVDIERLNLPQNVKISIKGVKNTEIIIENTKFEDSEMKTPFRIPENYQKIKLHE